MRRVLKKITVFLLAVGLTAAGATFSHAQNTSAGAAAHENHAVMHYADLAIDPTQDDCLHSAPGTTQSHDNGLCDKCCAACLGASLLPAVPVIVCGQTLARDTLSMRQDILIARSIPTEPDIPKPL
jgi:hypothetical protein